jgi:uncharacterized protein (TIGR00251 family)
MKPAAVRRKELRQTQPAGSADERPWSISQGGISLAVRLTPKGGSNSIEGVAQLADGRQVLKARVRAAASEGEANAALIKLIARQLGVAARDVDLVAGAHARLKRLKITGCAETLVASLETICSSE